MDNGSQGHLSQDDIQAAPGPAISIKRTHSSQDMFSPHFWSAVLNSVRGTTVNHNALGVRGRDAEGTQWLRDLGHSTWSRQAQWHMVISKSLRVCHRTKGADMICGTQELSHDKSKDWNHSKKVLAPW